MYTPFNYVLVFLHGYLKSSIGKQLTNMSIVKESHLD